MPGKKELYFVALTPSEELAQKVHSLKLELAEKYGTKYSLKIPEHITIVPPFHCSDEDMKTLSVVVSEFANTIVSFEVELKNFGHFSNRVIFIPSSSQPPHSIGELFYSIKNLFLEKLTFLKNLKLSEEFVPHMTIANRDMKPTAFREAWKEFGERKFEESFTADHLTLLRLENQIWKPVEKFMFKIYS